MLQVQSKAFKWKIFGDLCANSMQYKQLLKKVNAAEKLVSCPDQTWN